MCVKNVGRAVFCAALVLFAMSAVFADELPVPTVKVAGFSNGKLNVCVAGTPLTGCKVVIQMKTQGADDTDYATVFSNNVTSMSFFDANAYDARHISFATNFTGTADVRLWCVSNGVAGATTEVTGLSAYVNVKGTAIGTATSFANAVDGAFFSMVDESTNPWIGYDYGEAILVKRVRFYFRPDLTGRSVGAKVQYASDTSFSDATTIFTVTQAQDLNWTRMNEVVLDTPVSARCVRIVSGTESGCRSSVCEFEVIPEDPPYKPVLAVTPSDITNFYPVLTWSIPTDLQSTKITIMRNSTELATELDLAEISCYTDLTVKVGIPYVYSVLVDCHHPNFEGKTTSSSNVKFRRLRRLDRAWTDLTKFASSAYMILPMTNGTMYSIVAKAFDGDPDTYPDDGKATYTQGPVGIDFGERVWVGAFGYICRHNNDCYSRIMNTQLCASESDDTQRVNKIVCSEYARYATQDDTFYYQEATSIPDTGAPCWFLYGTRKMYRITEDGFCLNVAELAFFGWTQQDLIDAGVLVAPNNVTVVRAVGGGVTVSWAAGANAVSYRVERRLRGSSDDWIVVAADVTGTSCVDTEVTQNFWMYRVVAVKGDEEAASDETTYAYYVAGNGTGLRGTLYAPYQAQVAAYSRPTNVADFAAAAVDFSVADGDELAAGSGVTGNARILWRGELIIPFDGTYTFTLEASQGGAIIIDNKHVCNCWDGTKRTVSGQMTLAANETHKIEVQARLESAYQGRRFCTLKWGGPIAEEVIPASQLVAEESAPRLVFDGWNVRQFSGSLVGRAYWYTTSSYLLEAPNDNLGNRNDLRMTALLKPWRYSLDLAGHFRTQGNGRTGVMVRGADGNLFGAIYQYDGGGNSYVGTIAVTNGSNACLLRMTQIDGFSNVSLDLRLTYDCLSKTFTAWWKDDYDNSTTNPTVWTVCGTFTNDGQITGEYEYGYFVSGHSINTPASFEISQRTIDTKRPGMCILFR